MKKKKTIAFVIHSLSSGGAERVVSTLSNELAEEYNIIIINFIANTPFYALKDTIKVVHCNHDFKPSKNVWQAIKLNFGFYQKIKGVFKTENIDLGIGFMTTANILTILAAKALRTPVIVSERIDPTHTKTPFVWRQLKKWTYPKTDYLVVQTEPIKKFYSTLVSDQKLVILPNPISTELISRKKVDETNVNTILNVGRLTDQKGQDILIKAFANLNPMEWKLLIVGEGPKREEYQKLINNLQMEDKIFLEGKTNNISDYYNKADIFAFTSHFEGFPNALIEAMYMGLACISTDCPTGPSELIKDGENGFLIDVNDQKALEKKLSILMNNNELIETFSESAKSSVQKFKVKNVIKSWKEIIISAMTK